MPESVLTIIRTSATMLIRTELFTFGDLKNLAKILKYNMAPGSYQKNIVFRVEPKIGIAVEIASVA